MYAEYAVIEYAPTLLMNILSIDLYERFCARFPLGKLLSQVEDGHLFNY